MVSDTRSTRHHLLLLRTKFGSPSGNDLLEAKSPHSRRRTGSLAARSGWPGGPLHLRNAETIAMRRLLPIRSTGFALLYRRDPWHARVTALSDALLDEDSSGPPMPS